MERGDLDSVHVLPFAILFTSWSHSTGKQKKAESDDASASISSLGTAPGRSRRFSDGDALLFMIAAQGCKNVRVDMYSSGLCEMVYLSAETLASIIRPSPTS